MSSRTRAAPESDGNEHDPSWSRSSNSSSGSSQSRPQESARASYGVTLGPRFAADRAVCLEAFARLHGLVHAKALGSRPPDPHARCDPAVVHAAELMNRGALVAAAVVDVVRLDRRDSGANVCL